MRPCRKLQGTVAAGLINETALGDPWEPRIAVLWAGKSGSSGQRRDPPGGDRRPLSKNSSSRAQGSGRL